MEEFNIECSDEEYKNCTGPWEPEPEEIDQYYSILDKNELPELNWKCPGYRSPSPEQKSTPVETTEVKPMEDKSDFDFMDEMTSPKLKIRKDGEDALKGSAKKKTTSLDGVINNMRRHKLIIPQAPNDSS